MTEVHENDVSPFFRDPASSEYRVRTFENFEKGIPPPAPERPFQYQYYTSARILLYKGITSGALTRCWRFVIICGLLSMTATWLLRSCRGIDAKIGADSLITGWFSHETVSGNFKAANQVQRILLPLASFLLALYVHKKLGWFDDVMDKSWALQGKLHSVAMQLAGALSIATDQTSLVARFKAYRYLNVVHFLLYQAVAKVDGVNGRESYYENIDQNDLLRCGLLTHGEMKRLVDSPNKRNTVLSWLLEIVAELTASQHLSPYILPHFLNEISAVREQATALDNEMSRHVPISFAQLMQLMVDMLMILTPMALAHLLETNREGYSLYIWPVFASMGLALFYQGGMKLIVAMELPFGHALDSLKPDTLIMSTERQTFSFLAHQRACSECIE